MAWQGRLDSERYQKSGKIGEINLMKYKKANAKSFTWDKITPCSYIDRAQTCSKTGLPKKNRSDMSQQGAFIQQIQLHPVLY